MAAPYGASEDFPGYEASGVCCPVSCGQCGGPGCSDLPGGKDCCTSDIMARNVFCFDAGAAPCIIDDFTADDDQTQFRENRLSLLCTG